MKPAWQRHLIICLFLGLLAVPIYCLDQALFGPVRGGGNWITLNLRGLIFRPYITFLVIYVAVSSLVVLLFPRSGVLRIYFGSIVVSLVGAPVRPVVTKLEFISPRRVHQRGSC